MRANFAPLFPNKSHLFFTKFPRNVFFLSCSPLVVALLWFFARPSPDGLQPSPRCPLLFSTLLRDSEDPWGRRGPSTMYRGTPSPHPNRGPANRRHCSLVFPAIQPSPYPETL